MSDCPLREMLRTIKEHCTGRYCGDEILRQAKAELEAHSLRCHINRDLDEECERIYRRIGVIPHSTFSEGKEAAEVCKGAALFRESLRREQEKKRHRELRDAAKQAVVWLRSLASVGAGHTLVFARSPGHWAVVTDLQKALEADEKG